MSHNTESVLKGAFAQERDFDGQPAKISYHAKISREAAWRQYEHSRNRRATAQRIAARIVDPVPPVRDQSEDRTQPRFVVAYFPDGKAGYGEGKWGVLRADNLELYDGMFTSADGATKTAVARETLYIERGGY